MKLTRLPARLLALAAAFSLVVSCDTRNTITGPDTGGGGTPPTPPVGSDNTSPTLSVKLATGSTSADTIVYIGGEMGLVINAADNLGLAMVQTTMRSTAGTTVVDSATFNPTVATTTRTYTIDASKIARGDRLVFTARASDASANQKLDSLSVTVADTATPVVTIASKVNPIVKGLDSIDVVVTATDVAGIDSAGFRLVRVRAPGDTVVVFSRSAKPAVRTTTFTIPDQGFRISDTLPIGQYLLVPFAADRSGLSARNVVPFSFQLTDATRPQITLISPIAGQKVGVGDSILVRARITDNAGLASVSFGGYSQRGDSLLGTNRTDVRYSTVRVPGTGVFPLTRDTTITRYLKVVQPVDSTADTLFVTGTVTDVSGLTTTVRVKVQMTNGPKVTLIQPILGDSLTAGDSLTIKVSATSSAGVASLGFALSDSGFATSVSQVPDSVLSPPSGIGQSVTYTRTIFIPSNATGVLTITPRALDVNGQPGASTPFRIAVRKGAPPVPLVHQTIAPRIELVDSVTITASGTGLRFVGFTIRDFATNALVDSQQVTASASSFGPRALPFNIATQFQGTKVRVTSYAVDALGKVGYAVPATVNTPQSNFSLAAFDTSLVVYGQTYALPAGRTGTIADLEIDPLRGNVFLSNITQGRLEVWRGASKSFDANGVVVGSQPWGMTMSRTAPLKDTLYVANSGGTNLSRVYIGPGTMKEDASNRIVTRLSFLYTVTEIRESGTGRYNISHTGPIQYSDRPQYVQQSVTGNLYVSTKPTPAAPTGTLRYLNPASVAPDFRFLLDFAGDATQPTTTFAVANLDEVTTEQRQPANDAITLCDHNSGTLDPKQCVRSTNGLADAVAQLRALVPGTDIAIRNQINIASLGFKDTTYVAASKDGKQIAFGEGNRSPTARTILLHDDGLTPVAASASALVVDLINNASDQVFGIALDSTGQTLGVHGNETYFTKVGFPFELRLQGKKSTFATGAGVAFHPGANGPGTPQDQRLAFVASSNGTVEAVDIAYYDFNRGSLATKFNLYGPLRVSRPFPGDPANVVLKLFGLNKSGLVIINVTAADLIAGP
jgi:hypothetical protein